MVQDIESLGAYLKRIREEKKLTVEDVALSLNIKKDNIEAIEADTILDIIPTAYARGFVRNYAEILEIDRHSVIERFDSLYRKDTPRVYVKDVGPLIPAERRQKRGKSLLGYILFLLIAAAIVAAVWYQWHQSNLGKDKKKQEEKQEQESNLRITDFTTERAESKTEDPGVGEIIVPTPVFLSIVEVSFSKNTKMKANVDGTDIYGAGKTFGAGVKEVLKPQKSLVLDIHDVENTIITSQAPKLTNLPSKGKVKLTFDEANSDKPRIESALLESPQ